MRLKKEQKENVLAWISEGIETDEINQRAAKCTPPFEVSRQQVDYYRHSRAVPMQAIRAAAETDALKEGFARKEVRVEYLNRLAMRMSEDLFGGLLWTEMVKSVGSGEGQQIVDYEEFNASEVREFRGVLDDIAKEVGDRKANDAGSLTAEKAQALVNSLAELINRYVTDKQALAAISTGLRQLVGTEPGGPD